MPLAAYSLKALMYLHLEQLLFAEACVTSVVLVLEEAARHIGRCQDQVAPTPNLFPALLQVGDATKVTLGRDAIQVTGR